MNQHDESLYESLEELERQLETPVVPGELETWLEAFPTLLNRVQAELKRVVDKVHPAEYEKMTEDDLEFQRRVEQLQETDQQLTAGCLELLDENQKLIAAADNLEPDENKMGDALEDFNRRGLELVIGIRRQEESIRTWQTEAAQRDRGVVD